jgi:hypothetical protein
VDQVLGSRPKRLDLILNLHNVESGENNLNVFAPLIYSERDESAFVRLIDEHIRRGLAEASFLVPLQPPTGTVAAPSRFGGWLAENFGATHLLYELNSQAPSFHLTNSETRRAGAALLKAAEDFLHSGDGRNMMGVIDKVRLPIVNAATNRRTRDLVRSDAFLAIQELGLQITR